MFRILLLSLMALLTACSQAPVSFDYDPSAYLKTLKTYAISTTAGAGGYQSLDNSRIEAALRKSLAGRQLQEVAADKAEFLLAYRVEQERKLDDSGVSFGIGLGTGNVGLGVGTGTKPREKVEGKLVVDVIDPAKKQVVWSAKANRNLTDSMGPAERDQLINTLVSAMFASFPPQ